MVTGSQLVSLAQTDIPPLSSVAYFLLNAKTAGELLRKSSGLNSCKPRSQAEGEDELYSGVEGVIIKPIKKKVAGGGHSGDGWPGRKC